MTPCIEWPHRKDSDGYGRCQYLNKSGYQAHRAAWEIKHGPIPPGLVIDHLCRNRGCVNVDHLELVTQAENVRRGWPAQKTACVHGHSYDAINTYIVPSTGRRNCRACRKLRDENRPPRQKLDSSRAKESGDG